MAFLRGGRLAVTFLTRIPVGGFPYHEAEARWASSWFPAVGAALGALYAGVHGLGLVASAELAAVLVVAAALYVTGAFHEDGLADTADALGGAVSRERALEIMKDSRIGSYGAAALTVVLLLRVALLVRLQDQAFWVLLLSESLSRCGAVWLMTALPYATEDAHAKSRQLARAGWAQAVVALGWSVALLAFAGAAGAVPVRLGCLLLATGLAATWFMGWRARLRLGGVTGDVLGATQQVTSVAVQLAWAMSLSP